MITDVDRFVGPYIDFITPQIKLMAIMLSAAEAAGLARAKTNCQMAEQRAAQAEFEFLSEQHRQIGGD